MLKYQNGFYDISNHIRILTITISFISFYNCVGSFSKWKEGEKIIPAQRFSWCTLHMTLAVCIWPFGYWGNFLLFWVCWIIYFSIQGYWICQMLYLSLLRGLLCDIFPTSFIVFHMLNHLCISGINPTWSCFIIFSNHFNMLMNLVC